MTTPAYSAAHWRKSSYSNSSANCVEVSRASGKVGVRDSKHPGPALVLPAASWATLLRVMQITD
ncbi:MAG: DUF397 domain-containing protein [Sciscionella sp.]